MNHWMLLDARLWAYGVPVTIAYVAILVWAGLTGGWAKMDRWQDRFDSEFGSCCRWPPFQSRWNRWYAEAPK